MAPPVHYDLVDEDEEFEHEEDTQVRRFTLNSNGVARPRGAATATLVTSTARVSVNASSHQSPPSRTLSPLADYDHLTRAMEAFHRTLPPSTSRPTTPVSAHPPPVEYASPTPRRHGSISSASEESRAPSSQGTVVESDYDHKKEDDKYDVFAAEDHQHANHHNYTRNEAPWSTPHAPYLATIHSGTPLTWGSAPNPPLARPHTAYTSYATPAPFSAHPTGTHFTQTRPTTALPFTAQSTGYPFSSYQASRTHLDSDLQYEPYSQDIYTEANRSRSPGPEDEDYDIIEDFEGIPKFPKRIEDPEKGFGAGVDWIPSEGTPVGEYADSPIVDTQHYGPAPAGRQVRRRQTKKKVPLTMGHFVINMKVPSKIVLPYKKEPEMQLVRYTAITCDPDNFEKEHYVLRQNEYSRRTELFIVITLYNENEVLLCRTLYGIMKNITQLTLRKQSKVWGPESWKKVVVCLVADGRKKVHPRVLDCLTAMGIYRPEYMMNQVNGRAVKAHMFEYTASFGISPDLTFKYPDKGVVPTQMILLIKEKNQKKINSHRWFFNALSRRLQPNICVLLDVGTRPGTKSLYNLWKAFDVNSNVGGACGEIAVYKGPMWRFLMNPLVAAQNFEYKMSNILDKTCESMFGHISVLPGAFSAYRWIALQNDKSGKGPLASYFKGEVLHGRETDIFTSNMYLAEDRILSFELVAKKNSDWVLKYVRGSVGETDVPDSLDELIMQRRRWLNGSFFAAVYALAHTGQVLESGHSFSRKIWLSLEAVYNLINLVFSWFAIGNFFLFFVILTTSIEDPIFGIGGVKFFNLVAHYLFGTMVMACFLFSMGNRPKASTWKYKTATSILAVLTAYMVFCAVLCAVQAAKQIDSTLYRNMLFSIVITYGAYLVSSLLAMDPWHVATCMLQYTLLSPMYIIVLNIYAFANLDDISWGTKGTDTAIDTDLGNVVQDSEHRVDLIIEPERSNDMYMEALENLKTRKPPNDQPLGVSEAEKELIHRDYYANVRTNLLLAWALTNGLLVVGILSGSAATDTFGADSHGSKTRVYMAFVLAFVAITNIVRFLGSTLYLFTVLITG